MMLEFSPVWGVRGMQACFRNLGLDSPSGSGSLIKIIVNVLIGRIVVAFKRHPEILFAVSPCPADSRCVMFTRQIKL